MQPKFRCEYAALGGPIAKMSAEGIDVQSALQKEVPESVVKELQRIQAKYQLISFSVRLGITEED